MSETNDMLHHFSKDMILDHCDCKTYDDMLRFASDYLYEKGCVKETFKEAILKREEEYFTGLRCDFTGDLFNVGIPHTYPEHVITPGVFVIKMDEPIDAREMGTDDGTVENVRFIFMLLLEQHSDSHLKMLQGLIAMFQNEDRMKELGEAKTVDEIYAVIEKSFS